MDVTTEIEVAVDARGRTVARRLHCEAPLLARVVDDADDALTLLLVGGAAGPLGGDHLRTRLWVRAGARLIVRSVAAMLAQPGPRGEPSLAEIDVTVEDGATLDWAPEPMLSVVGSDHRTVTRLTVADDAQVRWVEEIVLGRHAEPGGRLVLRQRVERGGAVLLDHETAFGTDALAGPGGHGAGRVMRSTVLMGDDAPTEPCSSVDRSMLAATFPLAPRAALQVTWSP